MDVSFFVYAGSAAFVLVLTVVMLRLHAKREQRDEAALEEAVTKSLHLPPSLHPVIDAARCIGCFACLKACPEGDILGVVDGKAALISAANCIGHGRCARECPTDAIQLVVGTSERGVDLPEVDEHFETSRPGVYVVGELGGMGLIKNAMTQGLQVAEWLGASLQGRREGGVDGEEGGVDGEKVDVAIVGAGPAGIATALGCQAAGLSYRLMDQEQLGGTVAQYPRQKLVMTEPVQLPGYGKFGKKHISKEELLGSWQRIFKKAELVVREKVKVTGLSGEEGRFELQTSEGAVRARRVVLATGRRGSPRKLGVLGEQLPKVTYRLLDAQQYDGCRVLVVGGGDSALEASIQLAEESTAEVFHSYRAEAPAKCREANRRKFEALVAQKKIHALMPSVVKAITAEEVLLELRGIPHRIPNDYVVVNIGGELPLEFLNSMGVAVRRYHGEAPGAARAESPKVLRGSARTAALSQDEQRKERRLRWVLGLLGAAVLGGLMAQGWEYYLLPRAARLHAPEHAFLKPAGPWGHGVGIVATLVMMSNFLYSARKRLGWLKGGTSIRRWLTFHVFVGFLSPVVIAFHAAFQANNQLAVATAASLGVVVSTGIVGRFVYGLLPTHEGRTLEYGELLARWLRLRDKVQPLLSGVEDREGVQAVLKDALRAPSKGTLASLVPVLAAESWRRRRGLARIRSLFPSKDAFAAFAEAFERLGRLRTQVSFYRALRRFMAVWRVLHIVLALFMVVMIAAHIGVSLYLGYRWILP